ncbi:MAG TPA: radical SAM protein [Bacteroidales bacterium]|nr:radical SAM protein [Bacteroidales bacterium]
MTDCVFITSTDSKNLKLSVYPYLGVGYLAAYLKKINITSKIYDVDANSLNINKIIKLLHSDNPCIIGYSIMSNSLPFFYKLTSSIKKEFKKTILIAGGPHVTNDPQIIMDLGLDFGFRGDCEESFPLFCKMFFNNEEQFDSIPGIIINRNEEFSYNEPAYYDISISNVLPDYDLYNMDLYTNLVYPGVKWFSIITSRGCKYKCKFCSNYSQSKLRLYDLSIVKNQVLTLVKKYNVKWIAFIDDLFTYDRNRVIELCNFIIENNLDFKWSCLTRADEIDEDLLVIMKKAGLYNVILGVESGNENVRQSENKIIPVDQYKNIIALSKRIGVKTLCSYILGHPNETLKQINETLKFSRKIRSNYAQFFLMIALPGSAIFEIALNNGLLSKNEWSLYMKGIKKLPNFYPPEIQFFKIKALKIYAYFRFYFRPYNLIELITLLYKLFYYKIRKKNK